MNKNIILDFIASLSLQRLKQLVLILVIFGGLGPVISKNSYVMAQPYPPPDNQPAQQSTLPYPPPGAQPGTQQTEPYPAPGTPTSVISTPAYPPPGITPLVTQTPNGLGTPDPLSTPGLIPLPMEFLTVAFPTRSVSLETDALGRDHDETPEEVQDGTGMQSLLLFLISLLWIILGGWVYLITRFW
jgi:hypothetical protein